MSSTQSIDRPWPGPKEVVTPAKRTYAIVGRKLRPSLGEHLRDAWELADQQGNRYVMYITTDYSWAIYLIARTGMASQPGANAILTEHGRFNGDHRPYPQIQHAQTEWVRKYFLSRMFC